MLIRQRKVSKQIRRCFKDVGVGSITNSYARGTHSRVRSKTVRKSGTSGTTWAAGGQPTAIARLQHQNSHRPDSIRKENTKIFPYLFNTVVWYPASSNTYIYIYNAFFYCSRKYSTCICSVVRIESWLHQHLEESYYSSPRRKNQALILRNWLPQVFSSR